MKSKKTLSLPVMIIATLVALSIGTVIGTFGTIIYAEMFPYLE